MPVRVGTSYVSEEALAYAKARAAAAAGQEDAAGQKGSGVLGELAQAFPQLKFSVGTMPFGGTGTNNVTISPKVLKQMEQNADKRLEYEALLYDIAATDWSNGHTAAAAGVVIGDDGGLRGWGISKGDGGIRRSQSQLRRSDSKNWQGRMLDAAKARKKKSALKEAQEKRLETAREKAAERRAAKEAAAKEREDAARVELSAAGQAALLTDAKAADEAAEGNAASDGEAAAERRNGKVAINEEKRRRQILAAATQGAMREVLALLDEDLQQVEEGCRQDMCDADEVEKAKKLIEQARQQMARLPDREETLAEQVQLSVNMLI